jgi:phosphoglycolate phosphatase (TIGR01487 family)
MNLEALEILRKAEASGVRVIIASGNVLPIARALSTWIGTSGPVIAENGGIIYFNNETRYLTTKDEPLRAFKMLESKSDVVGLATNKWRETEIALDSTTDIDKTRKILAEEGYEVNVGTTGLAVHLNNPGVNKYEALKIACGLIVLTPQNVIAIGDYENDLEMIKNCGLGVAVANAIPEVKSVADYVTKNKNGLGIVEAIEKFILK